MNKHRVQPCEICHKNEAIYAVQIIGGEVSVYTLGWHIRGFVMRKVCDECLPEFKEKLQRSLDNERIGA